MDCLRPKQTGGESFFVESFNLKTWGKAKIYAYLVFPWYHRQLQADVADTMSSKLA